MKINEARYGITIMKKLKFLQDANNHVKGTFERNRFCYYDRVYVYG